MIFFIFGSNIRNNYSPTGQARNMEMQKNILLQSDTYACDERNACESKMRNKSKTIVEFVLRSSVISTQWGHILDRICDATQQRSSHAKQGDNNKDEFHTTNLDRYYVSVIFIVYEAWWRVDRMKTLKLNSNKLFVCHLISFISKW